MNQPESTLTAQQTALQGLALRQLEAVTGTLRQLVSITEDQGDREAVEDAIGNCKNSVDLLRDWFGVAPETMFDE